MTALGYKKLINSLLKFNSIHINHQYNTINKSSPQLITFYLNVYYYKCKSQKISKQSFAGVVGTNACLKTNQGYTHFILGALFLFWKKISNELLNWYWQFNMRKFLKLYTVCQVISKLGHTLDQLSEQGANSCLCQIPFKNFYPLRV